MKTSEAFEGENSSLRKAFDQAVNTPDTELNKHAQRADYFELDTLVMTLDNIDILLTSRDTYWKERVRKMIEEKITYNAQYLRKSPQDSETNFQTKRRRANNNYIKGQEQACDDLLQALDNLK